MAQVHWHQTSLVDLEIKSAPRTKNTFAVTCTLSQEKARGRERSKSMAAQADFALIEVMMQGAFQILDQLHRCAPLAVSSLDDKPGLGMVRGGDNCKWAFEFKHRFCMRPVGETEIAYDAVATLQKPQLLRYRNQTTRDKDA